MSRLDIPVFDDPEDVAPIWQFLSEHADSAYLDFVADAFWSAEWDEAARPSVREMAIARLALEAEWRQTEEDLKKSEEKLRTVFQILPIGISILDADRRILVSNPALERILLLSKDGLNTEAYTKRTYLKSDGTEMLPQDFPSTRAFKEQQTIQNVEIGVIKEDGELIWTQVSAVPVAFPDWKVVVTTADITQQKNAQKELKAYSEQLEDLEIAQEQLVRREKLAVLGQMAGSVGHELRTPLSTISNAVYYLTMVLSGVDDTTQEYLDIIGSEVRKAEKIIADLLDSEYHF